MAMDGDGMNAMTNAAGLTRTLAEQSARLTYADLPDDVRALAPAYEALRKAGGFSGPPMLLDDIAR